MAWQLKKLSTNEVLEDASVLPKNWGPIFGLEGFKDDLGDLSWVDLPDKGWFQISPDESSEDELTAAEQVRQDRDIRLSESDWTALTDVPMTSGTKAEWIAYRSALRDVTLQAGFPTSVTWPSKPE